MDGSSHRNCDEVLVDRAACKAKGVVNSTDYLREWDNDRWHSSQNFAGVHLPFVSSLRQLRGLHSQRYHIISRRETHSYPQRREERKFNEIEIKARRNREVHITLCRTLLFATPSAKRIGVLLHLT